ncbi:DUF3012 domain-containing protein [Sneathiella glossodoripedis]|uniref:DUF3012 domain-containing protein n=1 Tax=Sneathiella glossodoripedis TaxID=418853 RepID=UPI00046FC52C|nr:DUF3012 domain-containing protein [Sneathiella glossodoripedis]
MKSVAKIVCTGFSVVMLSFAVSACSPEVGSKEWCEDIKEKGAENVTAKEAADFAKHCVL